MTDKLVLTTFDWVPEGPRGYVRDLRVRWAMEEAGLPYRVEGISFKDRGDDHLAHQPFGQVPWLTDGDTSVFESGAILLYLANKSDALMPADPKGRSDVTKWVFAALNSVEMASVPWSIFKFSDDAETPEQLQGFLDARLTHLEAVLKDREWLAGEFSIADILMVDVLRLVDRFDELEDYPACQDYIKRGCERKAFKKAHADQLAHFKAADKEAE